LIPPTVNFWITSPPFAPLAQKVNLVIPVKSKPPFFEPQLLAGFCQYTPAQPCPWAFLAV